MLGEQTTVARGFRVEGLGIHSGVRSVVDVEPAPADFGVRVAVGRHAPFRAVADAVTHTRLGTSLGSGDAQVRTVEHWLAAMAGMGIDNVLLALSRGREMPILDGSALEIVRRLRTAGLHRLGVPRRAWVVRRPVVVGRHDGARVGFEPAEQPELVGRYDFPPPVGRTEMSVRLTETAFAEALAPARTFGFVRDLEKLRRRNQARGGRLDNALLFGAAGPINPGGLRFANECARHKLLDAVGDLALLGRPWVGRYVAFRGGHALNVALVLRALVTPGALESATG